MIWQQYPQVSLTSIYHCRPSQSGGERAEVEGKKVVVVVVMVMVLGKVVLGEWCGAKFSEIDAERLMWFHAEWVVLKDRCGSWIRENFSWGQMWYGVYRDWFWRGQSMGKYVLYGLSRKMTLLNNILRILKPSENGEFNNKRYCFYEQKFSMRNGNLWRFLIDWIFCYSVCF